MCPMSGYAGVHAGRHLKGAQHGIIAVETHTHMYWEKGSTGLIFWALIENIFM